MFAEQRKSAIIKRVNTNSSVSLAELLSAFHVSETTIRRDLTELENAGELVRTHGGAIQIKTDTIASGDQQEQEKRVREKKSIANVVANMVSPGDTILLDAGTTTAQIARALSGKPVTLVTNSAVIAPKFPKCKEGTEIYSTGGLFHPKSNAFVGSAAESYLRQIRPDKAFISVDGISILSGATTGHMLEASIKKTMMEVSKLVYLVADHTKFGKEFFSVIGRVDSFDGIITDKWISLETVAQFREANIRIFKEEETDTTN
jgi:DeoR family fructose operon transcriptional repressor